MIDDVDDATAYPLGPALDFLQRLWQLSHALEQLSSRMEKSLGVTAQQRLIVRCVGKYPGVSAGRLAGLLHLDPGTVSAALRRLEEKGLLERRRDKRDSRRVVLGLTRQGRKLAHPAPGTVEHAVNQLLTTAPTRNIHIVKLTIDQLTALLAKASHCKGVSRTQFARSRRRRTRPATASRRRARPA